jgi:hypothetical protein
MDSDFQFSGNVRLNYAVFDCDEPIMWDEVDPAVHDVKGLDVDLTVNNRKATLFCMPEGTPTGVNYDVDASIFNVLSVASLARTASVAAIMMLEHLIDCGFDPYYAVNRVTVTYYKHSGDDDE